MEGVVLVISSEEEHSKSSPIESKQEDEKKHLRHLTATLQPVDVASEVRSMATASAICFTGSENAMDCGPLFANVIRCGDACEWNVCHNQYCAQEMYRNLVRHSHDGSSLALFK